MNKLGPVFYVSLLFVMLKLHHNIVIVIQGSRYPEVLTSVVLYIQGFLCSGILMSMGPYVQGFLCPGVVMSRGYFVQGLFHSGVLFPFPGVLTYITLSLSFRASDILGFLHPGVLMFRDSYVQGSFCPITIMSRGYYIQGF